MFAWEAVGERVIGSVAPLVLAWEAIGVKGDWDRGFTGVGLGGRQGKGDWEHVGLGGSH